MVKKPDSNKARLKRHMRVRAKISGTPERPRLSVFRSAKHIYAQIIDDVNGVTLASASSMEKGFEGFGGNKEAARKVGEAVAKAVVTACVLHLSTNFSLLQPEIWQKSDVPLSTGCLQQRHTLPAMRSPGKAVKHCDTGNIWYHPVYNIHSREYNKEAALPE